MGALAKDLVNKLCGGGETGAGVGGEGGGPAAPVGRSVVGALAKDLAHKLRAAPAARSPDAPRARPAPGALVGAIAGDLAVRMRGGVDAGKAQQKVSGPKYSWRGWVGGPKYSWCWAERRTAGAGWTKA